MSFQRSLDRIISSLPKVSFSPDYSSQSPRSSSDNSSYCYHPDIRFTLGRPMITPMKSYYKLALVDANPPPPPPPPHAAFYTSKLMEFIPLPPSNVAKIPTVCISLHLSVAARQPHILIPRTVPPWMCSLLPPNSDHRFFHPSSSCPSLQTRH
jgi:hypothetical protein